VHNTSEYWDKSYKSGQMAWDIGGPTPVFNEWINTYNNFISICVLGAGNGWDAINFAKKGHFVTAVDFAPTAVKNMRLAAKRSEINISILRENILNLNKIYTNKFNVIVEYTCFCAIDPKNRINYIKMVYEILKPNGKFVGILFPIDKAASEGGPPFGIELKSTLDLFKKYFRIIKYEKSLLSVESRKDREVFVIFEKV